MIALCCLTLAGCAGRPLLAPPSPSPTPPALPPFVATADPEIAIPQLIMAERESAHRGDLALLAQLWADDAHIIDRRGTPDPGDDYRWGDRAAILDRYVVAVFPAPPPAFDSLPQPVIDVTANGAVAHNGNDRWTFTWADGRWWIQELAY